MRVENGKFLKETPVKTCENHRFAWANGRFPCLKGPSELTSAPKCLRQTTSAQTKSVANSSVWRDGGLSIARDLRDVHRLRFRAQRSVVPGVPGHFSLDFH